MGFPKDFTWGAAAASYQIEGASRVDGKGPSVWDMFCSRKGAVFNGHTGDVACDHYHRYREDVALMSEIGLQAYRLSLSWPRILPEGTGKINEKGLEFYDRLIDELLSRNIQPWVTLFHWDFPLALFRKGGWLSPDSPKWFADYAAVACDRLSDRVRHWFTFNEPTVFLGLGHDLGNHAPGLRLPRSELLLAVHHVLLSHGLAVQMLRAKAKQELQVGWAPHVSITIPETHSEEDIAAARHKFFGVDGSKPHWDNAWYNDPVYLGHYPEDGLKACARDLPEIGPDDMKTIHQPLDFMAFNNYYSDMVRASSSEPFEQASFHAGYPRTAFNWNVTPEGYYWGPKFMFERYGLPVVISENGLSCTDWVSLDGKVHDTQRIDFLHRYLKALCRAGQEGVPLKAYFQWSIMDNFEWAEGYKERFGLIFVDYPTQNRILKDSAHWYRTVIQSNGKDL